MLENFGWLLQAQPQPGKSATSDPPLVRFVLIALAMLFLLLFLFIPVAAVFAQALQNGLGEVSSSTTILPLSI
jgi:sulfate transport system permease protein